MVTSTIFLILMRLFNFVVTFGLLLGGAEGKQRRKSDHERDLCQSGHGSLFRANETE